MFNELNQESGRFDVALANNGVETRPSTSLYLQLLVKTKLNTKLKALVNALK